MEKKDLKTAQDIELVENSSISPTQSVDSTEDSHTVPSDQTVIAGDKTALSADSAESAGDLPRIDRHVGKIIGGHYQILSLIGHGGMSTVYKARHQLLNREVAIKFLSVGRQFDSKAIERFREEAKAAVELQHSNICATREFGISEDGVPFLVMDLVEGNTLAELLNSEKKLSQRRSIEVMLGICTGLKHAHESGVIHRDIKPANIILTKNKSGVEDVKIVDFGIAKLIREDDSGPNLTQTGEVFGTPKYMSPEQCHGNKVDQRADIYALGCILYEMLSGNPPFCNDSAIQILFAHVNQQPSSLGNDVSKDMRAIVDKCLQKDPALRYQRIAELIADLESIKTGQKAIHAHQSKAKSASIAVLITMFVVLLVVSVSISVFAVNKLGENNLTKDWENAHTKAVSLRHADNLPAEENQLEECLKIAQKSRNESLISLSLQELANVEESLHKDGEAAAHRQLLKNKIKVGGTTKFFASFSFLLIGLGIFVLFTSLLLFGKNKTTLRDVFTKR